MMNYITMLWWSFSLIDTPKATSSSLSRTSILTSSVMSCTNTARKLKIATSAIPLNVSYLLGSPYLMRARLSLGRNQTIWKTQRSCKEFWGTSSSSKTNLSCSSKRSPHVIINSPRVSTTSWLVWRTGPTLLFHLYLKSVRNLFRLRLKKFTEIE